MELMNRRLPQHQPRKCFGQNFLQDASVIDRIAAAVHPQSDEHLVEINPAEEIRTNDQLVVKGGYFLMSALKSGETVGCCAPAEEEGKKK